MKRLSLIPFFIFGALSALHGQNHEVPIDLYLSPRLMVPYSNITVLESQRPKIALALSGGGARGFAHIGVLKVLEQHSIPVDAICGTSIGAIIGGLSAVGYTAVEIESLAVSIRWDHLISNAPSRDQLFLSQKNERTNHLLQFRFKGLHLTVSSGYSSGHHFSALLRRLFLVSPYQQTVDFNQLHIPFTALSSDLLSGRLVTLNNGSLTEALRASMAIPLLFTPVRKDSMLLVDGGLIQNLPVSEARAMGADLVICVDASSRLRNSASLDAPWKIADQVTTIMQQEKLQAEFNSADIAVNPSLHQITNTDFQLAPEIIAAGEAAARAALPLLDTLLQNFEKPDTGIFLIKKMHFSGFHHTDPQSLLRHIPFNPADTLISHEWIRWASQALSNSGLFNHISAVMDTSTRTLTFTVIENPKISSIQISGNSVYNDSLLHTFLETDASPVLNTSSLVQNLQSIIQHYKQNDYGLAHIDSVWTEANGLFIHIDEGIIQSIALEGNVRSRPFVILREMDLKLGNTFKTSAAIASIDNIYSTGFFDEVSMEFPDRTNSHSLMVKTHERENLILQMGLKYNLERRVTGFLKLARDNILGLGAQGSILAVAGQKDLMFKTRFWSNRFLYSYLSYDFQITLSRQEFNYYKNNELDGNYAYYNREARIKLKQQMKRFGALSLQVAWQNIETTPIDGNTIPDENNSVVSFVIQSEVDTRNRYPFPESGNHHLLEYETAGSWLSSETVYTKIYSSMEHFNPVTDWLNIHPRIRWGTADITTPFAKQYTIGGMDSFIALPERALIGRRFINLNIGIRAALPPFLRTQSYVTIRYDVAGIWPSYSKIKLDDFNHAIGLIYSVSSPAGPISIGYGWMNGGRSHLYFTAGYDF